jgi:sugar diacid utilization regulator
MPRLLQKTFSHSQMEALIKVAEAVNSTLNLDELFQLTLKESIQAIPDADGGVLFLYDEEIKKLICLSFVNFKSAVKDISLDANESFTGKCFSTREPVLINSPLGLPAETETMTAHNRQLLTESIAEHDSQNAMRAMCVPLITDNDKCIGVITLNGFAEGGTFSDKDLRLLQAIAGQAAIALSKAQLHHDLKEKNEQFEQVIQYQHQLLLKMNDGVGLSDMLDQLSRQIQKPLSLLTIYGEYLQLGNQKENLEAQEFPIRSGRLLLGKLFVLTEYGQKISDADLYFIQQSILYFTLEINREATLREVEHRFKAELMDDLMNGMLTEAFIKRAKGLGLNIHNHFLPVAVEADVFTQENTMADLMYKRELTHLFQVEVNQRFPGSLVVQRQQHYIFLLSTQKNAAKEMQIEKIKRLSAELQSLIGQQQLEARLKFGIGSCVKRIEDLPSSIEDSLKILRFMRTSRIEENVMDSQSLGFESLLISSKDKDINAFVSATLGPVMNHDRKKEAELLKTLMTYTQFIQHPGQAAKTLHIHLNTLHYRLNKIEELLRVDLQNPDDLLNIQLACKLLRNSSG